jgi:hypothetical protein
MSIILNTVLIFRRSEVTVKTLRTALILVGLGLSFGASANASVINLLSGNGTAGGPVPGTGADARVQVYTGSTPTNGTIPFTPITNPSYTPASVVVANPAWTASISNSAGTAAQWDAVSPTGATTSSSSAIYAYSFNETDASIGAATLSGSYAADDNIGMIWLNGNVLTGLLPGTFTSATTLAPINISSYLTTGSNTLYIEDVNTNGGPSGVLFSFNISNTLSAVPEPSSIAMVSIAGLMAAGFYARRKRSIA